MAATFPRIEVFGLPGLPELQPGDDLVTLTNQALERSAAHLESGDVVVFTQKAVSKAEGRLVRLEDVLPSPLAVRWAARWGKDARTTELALREAVRLVRMDRGIIVAETAHGFVCANAGVDTSNLPSGYAALLPIDPDDSAERLLDGLERSWGCRLGVVVSDTFGRPWREGQVNVAIGVAGLPPIRDYRGQLDTHGRELRSTAIAVADELASAAELVMDKSKGIPVAVVRGTGLGGSGTGRATLVVRRPEEDMFR